VDDKGNITSWPLSFHTLQELHFQVEITIIPTSINIDITSKYLFSYFAKKFALFFAVNFT